MIRFHYYKLKFVLALFLAFVKLLKALPFSRRYRVAYYATRVYYVGHRADIDYLCKCKISVKWARRLNEVEAVSASDKRLRKNQELNTQFRINKQKIYDK